jgi:lysozyme family protein
MSYLQEAVNFTRVNEGGVSNNPNDKGGLTNLGITLATLREVSAKVHGHEFDKNHDGTIDGIDLLMLDEDDQEYIITDEGYWVPPLDRLVRGICIKTFDFRFNMGIRSGTKILQTAVNNILSDSVAIDGVLGIQTITLANRIDQFNLYRSVVNVACIHYVAIAKYDSTQLGFVSGWINRAKRPPYADPGFSLRVA